jgi:hypothetical protein
MSSTLLDILTYLLESDYFIRIGNPYLLKIIFYILICINLKSQIPMIQKGIRLCFFYHSRRLPGIATRYPTVLGLLLRYFSISVKTTAFGCKPELCAQLNKDLRNLILCPKLEGFRCSPCSSS